MADPMVDRTGSGQVATRAMVTCRRPDAIPQSFRLRFLKLACFKQIIRSLIISSFPHSVFAARIPSRGMQTWSTTALTPLSYDTEPAVLITFDGAKYIFNVGENTNRAFCQSQQNFKRTRGVFLTQVGSQRAGGLGGKWWFSCLESDVVPKGL